MSSHRRSTKYFSRKFNARKALIRGLVTSLVEHGRIRTTIVKAKELRRHVEPLVTLGKTDSVATRRLLMTRVPNELTVSKLISDLGVRFKDRDGGYTRIIKLDRRPGDKAEMAFIEFVDYDFNQGVADKAATAVKGKKAKAGKDAKAVAQPKALVRKASEVARKRKSRRAMQNKSRQENRA